MNTDEAIGDEELRLFATKVAASHNREDTNNFHMIPPFLTPTR
jgi:hypothetical protein